MQSVPIRRSIVSSHAVQEGSHPVAASRSRRLLVRASSALVALALSAPLVEASAGPGPPSDSPFLLLPADVVARLSARDLLWKAPPATPSLALELDIRVLEAQLATAPLEGIAAAPLELALPYPDGRWVRFAVHESSILEPALAARYPEIRTFGARGIDDRTASGRLSLTPLGFHAMVLSSAGTFYIDPWRPRDDRLVLSYSYFRHDARRAPGSAMVCETGGEASAGPVEPPYPVVDLSPDVGELAQSGATLRTYRLALAATGEYSAAVCSPNAPSVPCAMAAIVTSINRVNGIYEREVAIRLVLVANNDLIVYTNGATDPYTNNNGQAMLNQNQANLDAAIGSANYDIGHVFSTGAGNVAQKGVVCVSPSKARAATGIPNPVGDGFDVDHVAHAMGHQFGADHTFNGTTSACGGGSRSASSAYEPGSGSTIMAYAGICGAENLEPHSSDIFHTRSFDQIVAYTTTGSGSQCAVTSATGNSPPVVDAGPSFTIPKKTPFTLTGSATDADGDLLTFVWEEFDLGVAAPPNTDGPSTVRPIFRTFGQLLVPARTFPRLNDILSNTATIGESMSNGNRTMTFRLTARDNRQDGGGVDYDSTSVSVSADAGPFEVTSPATAVTWVSSTAETVTWNVANTAAAPVGCAAVELAFSFDGGSTFPAIAAASTPNDGSEVLTVPNVASTTTLARLRAACVGNVFFDISNPDFTIHPAPGATEIFSDGFESGDAGAWSSRVPY